MSQLNVYIPDEMEEKIKRAAKKAGKSVSAFMLDAVRNRIEPKEWSADFVSLLDSQPLAGFPDEIADFPPQHRPGFDDP